MRPSFPTPQWLQPLCHPSKFPPAYRVCPKNNPSKTFFPNLQESETTQNGCKKRCAQGRDLFSRRSDLSSRRLCAEKYVTVMSTVPGCDVTTVQQYYTSSTSTPPRVARLCQIREASLVALRNFSQFYACSHVSIVRLVQSTTPVSNDSHSHSSHLYHLPSELVSIISVPIPSIDLNLWNRSRPSAFCSDVTWIHIGLG